MLIPDKPTLDKYLSVNADLDYENMEQHLRMADEIFILDSVTGIGKPLYDELIAVAVPVPDPHAEPAPTPPTPPPTPPAAPTPEEVAQQKVIDYLRTATAAYAYTLWAEIHSVDNSNSGISVIRTDKAAPVSDSKLDRLIRNQKNVAFRYLELAFEFLETTYLNSLNETDSIFITWASSTSFTIRKEILIASVSEFQQYKDIHTSRMKFLRLKQFVAEGELHLLKAELGDNLFYFLKAEYQAKGLAKISEALYQLMQFIQPCLANYAYARMKEEENADKNASIIKNSKHLASQNQKAMVDHLKANAELYPLYPFIEACPPYDRAFDNKDDSSQFVF